MPGPTTARAKWLASHLYQLGFDGVYYTARHDPAFLERSVAVFGGPGEKKLFVVSTSAVPSAVMEEGASEFGLLVLPPPQWS